MNIHPLPDSFRRIQDGEALRIGSHDWEVVIGRGHTPEHACYYCRDLGLLISGDQVLPRISSNVSVYPIEPDQDPMADWLASLEEIRDRVPADVLVLPAHNECFNGLHVRLAQLRQDQDSALQRLRSALQEPQRVVDLFEVIFGRAIPESDSILLGLATGEAIASLNYLYRRDEVTREIRDDVAWYTLRR
jgi:glyoxylase-like metal-dependent hydrolase (beta-lactamase superfamily II)